ncbi:MAG TPA: Flp pilus assembly protein CpaB [Terriglobales bacterium]|nr:Flp pilus assembly protein CpaB [Terriglobales bacterium]
MDRRRFLVVGMIAVVLAALVSFGALRVLRGAQADAGSTTNVVVAAKALQVGQQIQLSDLQLARLPTAQLPQGVFGDLKEVAGRGVIVPISEKEVVLNSKLAPREAGAGLPPKIPQGMRALSVRVREDISVAGFVQPGTRVDVLLTGIPPGSPSGQTVTTTVLENVEVLTANQDLQAKEPSKKDTTVVTLLLSPEDAQKLTLASTQGSIHLALRNPLDRDEVKPKGTYYGDLYVAAGAQPQQAKAAVSGASTRRARHAAVPEPSKVYVVEMIRGDKRDEAKF